MADYSELKKDELVDLARERGLEGYSDLKKDELVKALQDNDGVGEPPEGSGVTAEDLLTPTGTVGVDVPKEVVDDYQENYVPERQEEVKDAAEEGYNLNELKPEGSDPDNPVVEAELADSPEYQSLSDEEKQLADLALDARGPLSVQSPYGRVMTGAVSEEQAAEQEAERAKLPEDFVGDIPERVSPVHVERAKEALGYYRQTSQLDTSGTGGATAEQAYDTRELRSNHRED